MTHAFAAMTIPSAIDRFMAFPPQKPRDLFGTEISATPHYRRFMSQSCFTMAYQREPDATTLAQSSEGRKYGRHDHEGRRTAAGEG
jgi:hypothetical protein